MNISSPNRGVLSSYDCIDDYDEKEVSDDDDDDRNHKHRRREAHSQGLELGSVDQGLSMSRAYRRRNNFYENGGSFRDNESQVSESWKGFNATSFEKNVPGKFDKRRLNTTLAPQTLDFDHKYRPNLIPSGEYGFGRGRGRNPGAWNQRDSRISSVDIASQLVQQGPISSRGLLNISNQQRSSWSTFGLMPGIPNGGLDMIHSFGLQGALRQPINSSLNIVVPRQRCRDFEERGFCLRGDMCPMEHGVNHIVVEDVQSLSQFNLPVSAPSTYLLGKSSVLGSLPGTGTSSTLTPSKEFHINSSKPELTVADDSQNLKGGYSGCVTASVTDFYDPDQPSWNSRSELARSLEAPDVDEGETLLNEDLIDRHHIRSSNNARSKYPGRSNVTTVVPQSSNFTVWGSVGSSKNRLDEMEKTDSIVSSSGYEDNTLTEDPEVLGRWISGGNASNEMSLKIKKDIIRNTRKPSQKSLCTLFVNGIPQKSNKRETLLSHFQKFGEVVDIHIPANSERAFVQFSKREEAEAALAAPDAVMGNRFIKLWWAKRDSIPDGGLPLRFSAPCGETHPVLSTANRVGENCHSSASRGKIINSTDVSVSDSDLPKPLNGPKVPPKKLQSLEQMKEELRKKQEMLDQKRNDFRQKLDKLEKQASGIKLEKILEKAAKRPKVEMAADASKLDTLKLSDPSSVMAPPETSSSSLIHEAISLQPRVDREKSPSTPKGSAEPDLFVEMRGDGKSDHATSNGVENYGEAGENSQQEIC